MNLQKHRAIKEIDIALLLKSRRLLSCYWVLQLLEETISLMDCSSIKLVERERRLLVTGME